MREREREIEIKMSDVGRERRSSCSSTSTATSTSIAAAAVSLEDVKESLKHFETKVDLKDPVQVKVCSIERCVREREREKMINRNTNT